jgi:hypothetical protein
MTEVVDAMKAVISEVRKMMVSDLLEDDVKQDILAFVEKALSLKGFVDSVSDDLDAILADKKIDQKDVPKMIMIVLKVNKSLPRLLKLKEQVPMSTLKYLLLGTIYYYIARKQNELFDSIKNEEFRMMFSTLWQLVEYKPPSLEQVVEKVSGICNSCC